MPPTTLAKRKSGGIVDNILTIIYAIVIALAIRTVAFEPFNIPSGSMIPTLLVGDYLFVSKYSYGYSRFSLPFSPPLFSGRIFGSVPTRGDVAVFKLPRDTSIDYIKRIVGLPGDHLQMKAGRLYINGEMLPREPDGEFTAEGEGPSILEKRYIETLPGGRTHPILKQYEEGGLNDTIEFVVPDGFVFAMGDNRDNSLDSRVSRERQGVGYVPLEDLVGRAEFIFFSIDAETPWYYFWEWPFEIRWSRIFSGVH